MILEIFPKPSEGFAAGGGFIERVEECLVALAIVFPIPCLALIQHGVAAFADAVVDVYQLGFDLGAGVEVVPEGVVENRGAGLKVSRAVEEDAHGVGEEFLGAEAVGEVLGGGAGDVEGLPPFGQVDEFLADVFEVGHISGVHLAAHRGVEGFAELVLGRLAAANGLRFLAGVGADLLALHLELCQTGVEDPLHGLLDDVGFGGSILPGEPIVEFRPLLAGIEAEESFDDFGGHAALCVDGFVDDYLAHLAFERGAEVCLGFCADGFPLLAGDGLLAVGPAFHRRGVWIERDALLERWVSRDDSQEIPLLHAEVVHKLDIVPDLVHEGHHGRGFATGFDEVGV